MFGECCGLFVLSGCVGRLVSCFDWLVFGLFGLMRGFFCVLCFVCLRSCSCSCLCLTWCVRVRVRVCSCVVCVCVCF